MTTKRLAYASLLSLALGALAACGAHESAGHPPIGNGNGNGDLGATPGGVQDIGYVRDVIHGGGVPFAEDIAVEGLISEHDIPSRGGACDSIVCLRPALGRAPSLETGEMEYWVQIGLASGLGEFERPPLDLAVLIDKSASMSIDMEETNEAVTRLIDKLGPDDRLAVIAFDSEVHTLHELGPVRDAEALKADVSAIEASGGFDLMRGTRAGYEVLEEAGHDPDRLRRVVLLSCGYPSLNQRFDDPYSDLVLSRGQEGIGLSFFGVLLGYDSRLAELLGKAWGGSYGYLESLSKIEQVFDENFDFMMTPLAYDLAFRMEVGDRFELARLYGIPGDDEGEPRPQFEVATVFPSRGGGAIAARLAPADGRGDSLVGEVSLSYVGETAVGGKGAIEQTDALTIPDTVGDGESYWATGGVRKLAALVNMAEQMRAAVDAYHGGDPEAAGAIVVELIDYLEAEVEALEDDDLEDELELLEALLENLRG